MESKLNNWQKAYLYLFYVIAYWYKPFKRNDNLYPVSLASATIFNIVVFIIEVFVNRILGISFSFLFYIKYFSGFFFLYWIGIPYLFRSVPIENFHDFWGTRTSGPKWWEHVLVLVMVIFFSITIVYKPYMIWN